MSVLPDASDPGFPWWVNIGLMFGGAIASYVVVRFGYRKPPDAEAVPTPDARLIGIGGMISDRGSVMQLTTSLDRMTAVMERGVTLDERRYSEERDKDKADAIRDDLLDDLRRAGRLKE